MIPAAAACSVLAVSAPARFSASRLVEIVPKTATPRVAPTSRKQLLVAVALPRPREETAFWATRTTICMTSPRPRPITNSIVQMVTSDVSPDRVVIQSIAAAVTSTPAIGQTSAAIGWP